MSPTKNKTEHRPFASYGRDFFLYGLTFITLYIAAFSFWGILFQLINIYVPDPANVGYLGRANDLLRGFASSLIVAAPVFLWLTSKLKKEQIKNVELRQSAFRKWMTYLTLLIASVVGIVDVISIIYNFMGGELALRVFLKMAVVLVIALAGLKYYLIDIREARD